MEITRGNILMHEELAAIEKECFPPEQAASSESIHNRLAVYPDHFWVLKEDGKIISFINGMCTDLADLCDEMYADTSMHNEDGKWQMLFGVCTKKQWRGRGYASALIRQCAHECEQQGRKGIVLTCLEHMIPFYENLGFVNEGVSQSVHGDVTWYQMRLTFVNP